jgi:hypothetical protein
MLPTTSTDDSATAERTRGPAKAAGGWSAEPWADTSNPVGEPDAGNPHVRFDEREVETEHGRAIEAPADERAGPARPYLPHRATSRLYLHVGRRLLATRDHDPVAATTFVMLRRLVGGPLAGRFARPSWVAETSRGAFSRWRESA